MKTIAFTAQIRYYKCVDENARETNQSTHQQHQIDYCVYSRDRNGL